MKATKLMYDSTEPLAIPRNAPVVAGYNDGQADTWSPSEWKLFPSAQRVTITRDAGLVFATVLDVENGAATNADAPGWVERGRYIHSPSITVYTDLSNAPILGEVFDAAKVGRPLLWVAHWDGVAEIPDVEGWVVIGKQYQSPVGTGAAKSPGFYDVSVVCDLFPIS